MGTDPAMECMPEPLPNVDGGTNDGGIAVNLPDAGINAKAGPCAPTCNGQRACGFPDQTVMCGDKFCNTGTQVGEGTCDGEGHCGVTLTDCGGYVCSSSACETGCTSDANCETGYFCNGSGKCQMKNGLGVTCDSNPDECQSGYCDNNVCCNSDCAAIPGGTCNVTGSVGMCKCQVNAMDCNGSCELYYLDADNDGYGSKIDTGVVGCTGDSNNPPPAGRIAASNPNGHNDCDDASNQINPGISSFNATATWTSPWNPHFDWNCDGVVTYQYPTFFNGVCEFCNPQTYCTSIVVGHCTSPSCGGTSSTCGTAGEFAQFDCAAATHTGGTILQENYCCGYGCSELVPAENFFTAALYASAYTSINYTLPCGEQSPLTVCGSCDATGDTIGTGLNTVVGAAPGTAQGCK
jgi:hypothetical protein